MKTVWSFLSIKFECCKNTTGELASEQQQRIYCADEQTYTHTASKQADRQGLVTLKNLASVTEQIQTCRP